VEVERRDGESGEAAAFESKSQIENIIGMVELDIHNSKLGLVC
jgi:hypothetical protein